MALQY